MICLRIFHFIREIQFSRDKDKQALNTICIPNKNLIERYSLALKNKYVIITSYRKDAVAAITS